MDGGIILVAKSKIIKDLANDKVDLYTALKRTKVLLQDLNDEEILKWVNYEIEGYPDDVNLPDYRIVPGQLYGSYIKGSMAMHMKYQNVILPLGNMEKEYKDTLSSMRIYESIEAVKEMVKGDNTISSVIPPDLFGYIASANNDPYMIISSAYIKGSKPQIINIFSKVTSKLLDILLLLEKEFGNLDELDIDVDNKTEEELEEICNKLQIIIYNDKRVTIGNNNRIKDSTIASNIEK